MELLVEEGKKAAHGRGGKDIWEFFAYASYLVHHRWTRNTLPHLTPYKGAFGHRARHRGLAIADWTQHLFTATSFR
jgi:hypothetical protein